MTEAGWTRTKPTVAGWYWWRSQERSYEEVLMVLGDEKLGCPLFAMQDGEERALSRLGGEWLGPITPDSYQQGRVAGLREAANRLCYLSAQDACSGDVLNEFGWWLKEQVEPQQAQEGGVGDAS